MEEWAKDLPIQELDEAMWKDVPGDQLVIPPDDEVGREVLWVWHEHKGGGGIEEETRQFNRSITTISGHEQDSGWSSM